MICERVKRYTAIPASFRDASLRHASDDTAIAFAGMRGGEGQGSGRDLGGKGAKACAHNRGARARPGDVKSPGSGKI